MKHEYYKEKLDSVASGVKSIPSPFSIFFPWALFFKLKTTAEINGGWIAWDNPFFILKAILTL